jgi:hypothetical protein
LPVAVEDLNVDKLRTFAQEAIGLIRVHNLGWKIAYRVCPVLSSCGIKKQVDRERRPNACISAVTDSYINFGKYRGCKDYVGR